MIHAKVKNSTLIQYPYGFSELQSENPYTNFGSNTDVAFWYPKTEDAINNGYALAEVIISDVPQINPETQTCSQNTTPTLINNVWTLEWTVSTYTQEQQEAYSNQQKANNKALATAKLSATDWTQVADVPLLNKQAFTDYRAAVRAIALNPTVDAVFPQLPTEQWS